MCRVTIAACRFTFMIALLAIVSPQAVSEKLADPTRPLRFRVPVEQQQRLQLNSILIAEGRRFAVVNGLQVVEQDRVGHWRIVKIEADRVVVSGNGQTRVLRLHAEIRR